MQGAALWAGRRWPLVVSALVHGGVVLALAAWPGSVPPPAVAPPALAIEVVRDVVAAPPAVAAAQPPVPAPPVPSPPLPPARTVAKPVPPTAKPAARSVPPSAPAPPGPTVPGPVADPASSVPDVVSAPVGPPGNGSGGANGSGGVDGSGGDGAAARDVWMAALRARIQDRLIYPDRARKLGLKGRAMVRLQVADNGDLVADSLTLVAGTGSDILDGAALASIRAALPFIPPPQGGIALELPVAFTVIRSAP